MTDEGETPTEDLETLRARTEALERDLASSRSETEARLVHAEMKGEAIRAGMVDLDGLKLLDFAGLTLNAQGEVEGAAAMMARLRRDKPWLFATASSSHASPAPRSSPVRTKLATEMTLEEWRAARAELLRHR